jgi:putative ABC transport system permease protein
MSLLVLAAAIALFLGSIGIYGVISYVVSHRTAEIGVRLALGADPDNVRRIILSQGMKLAVAGIAIGLVAAAAMSGLLGTLLYEVSPLDPLTLIGSSVVFLSVAALACVIPARRAAHTAPAEALRGE